MTQQQFKQSTNSPAISQAIHEAILMSSMQAKVDYLDRLRECVFKAIALELSSHLSTEELDALTLSMEKQIIAKNA